jgi:pectinesterase
MVLLPPWGHHSSSSKMIKPRLITTVLFFSAISSASLAFDIAITTDKPDAIAEAINMAPKDESRFTIFIPAGEYSEKLIINRPNISFLGESVSETVIHFNASAGGIHPDLGKPWGTSGSATITINAPGFSAENLSIENRYDYLQNDVLPDTSPKKIRGSQAVALKLAGNSDKAFFKNIAINSYQDTLFIDSGRSIFQNCYIAGNVDFIFGAGSALFYESNIVSRPRAKDVDPIGYITAPSTSKHQSTGFLFVRNFVLKESELVMPNSMALGRPWHPSKTFEDGRYADPEALGHVVFAYNFFDDHIKLAPWYPMSGWTKEGVKMPFYPHDARFFEYKNCGPGARFHSTRRQLTSQAMASLLEQFLGDWNPDIGELNYACP